MVSFGRKAKGAETAADTFLRQREAADATAKGNENRNEQWDEAARRASLANAIESEVPGFLVAMERAGFPEMTRTDVHVGIEKRGKQKGRGINESRAAWLMVSYEEWDNPNADTPSRWKMYLLGDGRLTDRNVYVVKDLSQLPASRLEEVLRRMRALEAQASATS